MKSNLRKDHGHSAHLRRKSGPVQSGKREGRIHRRTSPDPACGAPLRRSTYLHHAEHPPQRAATSTGNHQENGWRPHPYPQHRHSRSHRLRVPLSAHGQSLPGDPRGIWESATGLFGRHGLRDTADADHLFSWSNRDCSPPHFSKSHRRAF